MNFNPPRRTIYYWILFIAAIVYLITAYNSDGYFHADEHFQIIEFARLKMGLNALADMTWEYQAQIRSTIQPLVCFLLFKFFYFVHVTEPYTLSDLLSMHFNQKPTTRTHFLIRRLLGISFLLRLIPLNFWSLPADRQRLKKWKWSGTFISIIRISL